MDEIKLKLRMLHDLSFNIPPSAMRYNVDRDYMYNLVKRMGREGLVSYTTIKDHPVFKGEPAKIWITDKGRIYLEDNKHLK